MSTTVLPSRAEEQGALEGEKPKFGGTYACISAFNDERDIAGVVKQALGYCGSVIVCDDGSVDGTSTQARIAGAFVIRHETSLGKGRSISDLMEEAIRRSPSGVVFMERECFGHVDSIPAIFEPIMKDEADVAVGVTGPGGAEAVDAGVMAMNSKALSSLTMEGFFSELGRSPQMAMASAKGLRFLAVSLWSDKAPPVAPGGGGPFSSEPPGGWRRVPRLIIVERPFLTMGIPGIALILAGLWLLADFLITYNYTGQIPVPEGVRGVIGLASIIFGMAFMISYVVAYAVKHSSEGKKE